MINSIFRLFESFFDYAKVEGTNVYHYDFYEFEDLVRFHVVKTAILVVIAVILAFVLLYSVFNAKRHRV